MSEHTRNTQVSLLAHPMMTSRNLAIIFDHLPINWHDRYHLSRTCRHFMTAIAVSRRWRRVSTVCMKDSDQRLVCNDNEEVFGPNEFWANGHDRRKAVWFLRNAQHIECLSISMSDQRYTNVQQFMFDAILDARKRNNYFLCIQHLLLTIHVTNSDALAKLGEVLQTLSRAKLKVRVFSTHAHHRATCSVLYKISQHRVVDKMYLALNGLHRKVVNTLLEYFKGVALRQLHFDVMLPWQSRRRGQMSRILSELLNNLAPDTLQQLKLGLFDCAYHQIGFLEHLQASVVSQLSTLVIHCRPPCRASHLQIMVRCMSRLAQVTPRLTQMYVTACIGASVHDKYTELPRILPDVLSQTASTSSWGQRQVAMVNGDDYDCCPDIVEPLTTDQLLQIVNVWYEKLHLCINSLTLGELIVETDVQLNALLSRWPQGCVLRDDDDSSQCVFRIAATSEETKLDVNLHILANDRRMKLLFR